ncbi:MAG: carboxypeptidase regulatory-like domain-containing protein, partial [Bacteroidales bacterium]|nr:carboxypeptidase regulatory-like domain-containing protein [Bacteroidales bacterium]
FLWSTGATTASITVCPTTNTTYYVTVSNAGCTAADEVNVNVNPAAIISGQPADLAVDLGATASFTVVSTGASFIQWEVSTDGGNTWTPTVDGSVYQGSATGTLIIGVTTLNLDGYMFKAVLGSPCGPSVVTSSATLSVVAPVISALLPNMTSCANEVVVPIIVVKTIGIGAISLTLNFDPSVLVYDSYQNLHPSLLNGYVTVVNTTANSVYFSWYSINPLNIIYDTLVELVFHSPNGGTSALNWDLATPGNCEFSDVATNVIPATFFAGSVVAIPSPAVTINPMDADITEGQNTSFSVTATNATAYQWQMSDDGGTSWYDLSDGAMYQGTQTSTLNIFGATVYMDEYEYRCVVSGTCSPDDVSNAANLNVRPIITTYIGQEVRCADDVIIPVYITHGYGVAGISLTLGFNTMVLNYVGLHSSHPDLVVGILNDNSTFGRVYISWYSTTPIDLGDTVLLKLRFTANPGSSSLVWDLSAPDNCQYNNLANEVIQTVWQNGFVTVNQTPLVYNVTGGGEYCAGGAGAVVGLAGSQNGLAYALMLDSVPTGQVVNGTGAAISFGPQMAAGVYTVVATNLVTGCDSEMQGSKTVVINPLPVANAGGDASMLLGTSILLEGSATNGTPSYAYMWTPGGMMTSDVTVSPSATQTYTLQVTDSKGCMDTDDVTVSVYSNTISGQVTYDNLAGTPMSNVTVYLNNDSKAVVATTTTNASGYYSFPPVVNGMYTITATTNKAWGGVNSTDALAIMQHFIKIDSLEGLALMAADVDGSGFINTTDAFNAARRFAQLINSFPVGDWVFEEKTVTLDENDMVTVDFMALCYGDVNRSHVPAAKLGTALNLTHKNIIPFAAGKKVILPVTLNTSAQRGAISMVLEVPAGITITDVSADYTRD